MFKSPVWLKVINFDWYSIMHTFKYFGNVVFKELTFILTHQSNELATNNMFQSTSDHFREKGKTEFRLWEKEKTELLLSQAEYH